MLRGREAGENMLRGREAGENMLGVREAGENMLRGGKQVPQDMLKQERTW